MRFNYKAQILGSWVKFTRDGKSWWSEQHVEDIRNLRDAINNALGEKSMTEAEQELVEAALAYEQWNWGDKGVDAWSATGNKLRIAVKNVRDERRPPEPTEEDKQRLIEAAIQMAEKFDKAACLPEAVKVIEATKPFRR